MHKQLIMLVMFALVFGCDSSDTDNETSGVSQSDSAAEENARSDSDDASADQMMGDGSSQGLEDLTDLPAEPSDAQQGVEEVMFGEPVGDPVETDPAAIREAVDNNLIAHLDHIDEAIEFLEDSEVLDNGLSIFESEDEIACIEDENGDCMEQSETEEEDDPISLDLTELRDDLSEILRDQVFVAANATASDDALSVTFNIDPEIACGEPDDPSLEPEDDDDEYTEEDHDDCLQTLTDNPITIAASMTGPDQLNMTISVGSEGLEVFQVQMYPELLAIHVDLANFKAALALLVDPEDFELPDTLDGVIGIEVRLTGEKQVTARVGISEAIQAEVSGDDEVAVNVGRTPAMLQGVLDGAAETIEGTLGLGELDLSMPWQNIIDLLHSDEDETEWRCESNENEISDCLNYDEQCMPACYADPDPNPDAFEACSEACFEALPDEVQLAIEARNSCEENWNAAMCGDGDPTTCNESTTQESVEDACRGEIDGVDFYCMRRDVCGDVVTPAPPVPVVDGRLQVNLPGVSGTLLLTDATDDFMLTGLGLGDSTMTVAVDGDDIIALDLNPENERRMDLRVEALPDDNFAIETTPGMDAQITFGMEVVKSDLASALDVDIEDMPEFLMSETLGIRLSGSEAPRIETIGSGDDWEFKVASGQLTLWADGFDGDVVVAENMCIGSADDDDHDDTGDDDDDEHLLEGLLGVACTAE